MTASSDMRDTLREAIETGLADEDKDVVAKFAGHALSYLRMFPPEDEPDSIYAGPKKGALAGYSNLGQA